MCSVHCLPVYLTSFFALSFPIKQKPITFSSVSPCDRVAAWFACWHRSPPHIFVVCFSCSAFCFHLVRVVMLLACASERPFTGSHNAIIVFSLLNSRLFFSASNSDRFIVRLVAREEVLIADYIRLHSRNHLYSFLWHFLQWPSSSSVAVRSFPISPHRLTQSIGIGRAKSFLHNDCYCRLKWK